jgi:DNA repair exonuclease SbcCD nuclease subunit
MKFLHCADIHLDSPLLGLDRYHGAPVDLLRGATRRALSNLVRLAIDERADFVVVAGDLFDGDWPDFNTGLFFVREMARLREAGIRVALARGNHDAESRLTKSLNLPDNVAVFDARKPKTLVWNDLGVALHGQSFEQRETRDDLAANYPPARSALFNLGVLHTALDGRPGHAPYAPTRLDTLRAKGYDYWALGHVHARETVCDSPPIVYPGNPQGRHARETGPKGCELVTVEDGALESRFVALDSVRWERLALDTQGMADLDALLSHAHARLAELCRDASDRLLAVRVAIDDRAGLCAGRAGSVQLEAELRALGLGFTPGAWIEKIAVKPRAALESGRAAPRHDAIGEVLRLAEDLKTDPEALAGLGRAALADLALKLPREAVESEDGLRFDDPDCLAGLLGEAQALLLARLSGEAAP